MLKKSSCTVRDAVVGTPAPARSRLRGMAGRFTVWCLAAMLLPATVQAQSIELDPNFKPSAGYGVTSALALPDGKIVIAGAFDVVHGQPRRNVARLNADGIVRCPCWRCDALQ